MMMESTLAHAGSVRRAARSVVRRRLGTETSSGLRQGVYPGRVPGSIPPIVHPQSSPNREQQRDHLSDRQARYEPVILGAHKLDHEPLDAREHTIKSEEPAF